MSNSCTTDSSGEGDCSIASNVIRNGNRRQCHIASILPLSESVDDDGGEIDSQQQQQQQQPQSRKPIDFRMCLEASAYLALTHLKTPENSLISMPSNINLASILADRLRDCDIDFSISFYDSQFSSIEAARRLQNALTTQQRPPPVALLGSARSTVSLTVATLAAAYQLPQISPSSTSDALEDKGRAPYFARTVPTNAGDAQAMIFYLKELGVTHFGIYYIRDDYGTAFHTHLTQYANQYGIKPLPFSYDSADDIPQTMSNMAASDLRYFIGIFNPNTLQDVFRSAQAEGLIGEGYTWFLTEASLTITDSAFRLSKETDGDVAQALHGTGILTLDVPPSFRLSAALQALFRDEEQRQAFFDLHDDPSLFDNWNSPASGCGGSSIYPLLAYDAVLSLGIAACETPTDLFRGPELFQQLLRTEFDGISGVVSFDNTTGTRAADDLSFRMANIRISLDRSDEFDYAFDTIPTTHVLLRSESIEILDDFVYADNSTAIPSPYPALEVELNLMTAGVRAAGLSLGIIVMLWSFYLLRWVIKNKEAEAVRAAQPVFLCQVLIGTIIILSALIPLSLQEPISQRVLDMACASVPWLISIGFVMAFSALFAKLWRINQLFGTTRGNTPTSAFTRRMIKAKDVAPPFLVLMGLNLIVLTTMTILEPLRWQRTPTASVDAFGRDLESYGTCAFANEDGNLGAEIAFVSLLLGVNIVAVICALYQAYLARNIPAEFSEVNDIAKSFVSMVEVAVLGVPIIILLDGNPSSLFIAQSIILSFFGMALLIPIMTKHRQHYLYQTTDPDGQRQRHWHLRAIGEARRRLGDLLNFRGNTPQMVRRTSSEMWRSFPAAPPNVTGLAPPPTTDTSNGSNRVSMTGALDRGISHRNFGQSRVRRTRDFYEQQNANTIRSGQRTEKIQNLRQILQFRKSDNSKSGKSSNSNVRDGSNSNVGEVNSSRHSSAIDASDANV